MGVVRPQPIPDLATLPTAVRHQSCLLCTLAECLVKRHQCKVRCSGIVPNKSRAISAGDVELCVATCWPDSWHAGSAMHKFQIIPSPVRLSAADMGTNSTQCCTSINTSSCRLAIHRSAAAFALQGSCYCASSVQLCNVQPCRTHAGSG